MTTAIKFKEMLNVDVREHLEKDFKGLSYLSWATAYQLMMENDPTATYDVLEDADGIPLFSRGNIHFVKTSVTMFGQTKKMQLPVMDNKHNAVDAPTSRQVSDCIMRCLVKNIAMFGIGLRVFRKEGLDEYNADQGQMNIIAALMKQAGMEGKALKRLAHEMFGKDDIRSLTRTEANELGMALKAKIRELEDAQETTETPVAPVVETPAPVVEETPAPTETPAPKKTPTKKKAAPAPAEVQVEVQEEATEAPKVAMITKEQYNTIGLLFKEKGMAKETLAKLTHAIQPNAKKPTDLTFEEADRLIADMQAA